MIYMRWLRKWLYLIVLVGMGLAYLVFVDHWQVYAKPLAQAKDWYEASGRGERSAMEAWVALVMGGEYPGEDISGIKGPGGSDIRGILDGGVPDTGLSGEDDKSPDWEDIAEGGGPPEEPGGAGGDGQEEEPGGEPDGDVSGEEPGEPVFVAVEDDYFSDALFIGDSRTVGLFKYGGLEEVATFYASTGLTVYKMFDSEIVSVPGEQKKITVEEALRQNTFSKIYLMIGINEMGVGTVDSFLAKYYEAVVHLRELQPDAIIFLQGIMKVTAERSAKGDYITNMGIEVRNVGISTLVDNETIFYLDVNPFLCDEEGGLISDYTFDGVHLKAKYYEIWTEYLKTHAISS